ERARGVELEQLVPGGAPQRLDHVPARAAELGRFVQAAPFLLGRCHGGYTLKYPRTLELIERPEITEVHHVVGEDCWILEVAVRDTVRLEGVLEAVSALGRTTTSIVLTSPVERKPLLP
ncbi:Lrp/AsnC ligand binding domain-containing protein, partial [Streptomyces sp. NPDC005329]|uniref:Lrp/AsnC ligand binding domain-containing protein n=1 Tax=Streptomyces sp. NPDC005329 TaxID=3157034 RepID=UPI0033A87A38